VTGERVHDAERRPQRNHRLVYEAGEEVAHRASSPQALIDAVAQREGLSFLAHPVDSAAPLINEGELSWVSWGVKGFTGLEIWNFMTEYKSMLRSWPQAVFYAYRPDHIASGPFAEVLSRWDQLLAAGRRVDVVAVAVARQIERDDRESVAHARLRLPHVLASPASVDETDRRPVAAAIGDPVGGVAAVVRDPLHSRCSPAPHHKGRRRAERSLARRAAPDVRRPTPEPQHYRYAADISRHAIFGDKFIYSRA
jgi:hypothetical protein